ncbi:MAG TPA: FMN-dependent NADH-azoreductase [Candidatus Competibacteraceae bacterium]|nr:FMN-dependent NADH-azoreductase [Candidatus Competibacteraceae bacterium]
MKLLHIDSSPLFDASVSRQLTAAIVEQWRQVEPALEVIHRDLAANPPAHLDGEILQAAGLPPEQRNPRQARELALTEALIEELFAAEAIVIGAPMYNFSVPSQLKAWIDRIAVAGRTFRYTEQGPQGLVADKPVVIVSSRGGVYSTPERSAADFQEAYLKQVLGFIGIHDITFIRAEGLGMGPELREQALRLARARIGEYLAEAA